jgi:hypothetical protein
MYAIDQLKPVLPVTDTEVACPVRGCEKMVKRQRSVFRTTDEYCCPDHRIWISPSTFEYCDVRDNLLWADEEDMDLLARINTCKRESRMARDNSEDALTWNVFRYLERSGLLSSWLAELTGLAESEASIAYWIYTPKVSGTHPLLTAARDEFGETPQRGSEPDLIIETDNALVLIEAKFLSGNNTQPSNPENSKKYLSGGNRWYDSVCRSPFGKLAVESKFYELTRLWLLGSWAAARVGKSFHLINLVRECREKRVEDEFGSQLFVAEQRRFSRATWEGICTYVNHHDTSPEAGKLLTYILGKSAGYNALRQLQPAFAPLTAKS